MAKMTKPCYPGLFHYIHRAISDVSFPVTKQELLIQAGGATVYTDWDKTCPLSELVAPIPDRLYSSAADFYCTLIAEMNSCDERTRFGVE